MTAHNIETDNVRPDQPSARHKPTLVLAALVAMVAAGVLLVRSVSADEEPDDASANLAFACGIAERLDESHPDESQWGRPGDDQVYYEVAAVQHLLHAAAASDVGHTEMPSLADRLTQAMQNLDFDDWSDALDDVVGHCSDVDTDDHADSAAANVEFACGIAERLSQTHAGASGRDGEGEDPASHELGALVSLLSAAAFADPRYQDVLYSDESDGSGESPGDDPDPGAPGAYVGGIAERCGEL